MPEPTKSLFQRLMERRAATSGGDPTGGDSMGSRGNSNTAPVRSATAAPKPKPKPK